MKMLTYEYELFRMKPEENIEDNGKSFIHIVIHLKTLRKTFQNKDLISKLLS